MHTEVSADIIVTLQNCPGTDTLKAKLDNMA